MTSEQRKERNAAKRERFKQALKAAQQEPMVEDRLLAKAVGLQRRTKLPMFCGRKFNLR